MKKLEEIEKKIDEMKKEGMLCTHLQFTKSSLNENMNDTIMNIEGIKNINWDDYKSFIEESDVERLKSLVKILLEKSSKYERSDYFELSDEEFYNFFDNRMAQLLSRMELYIEEMPEMAFRQLWMEDLVLTHKILSIVELFKEYDYRYGTAIFDDRKEKNAEYVIRLSKYSNSLKVSQLTYFRTCNKVQSDSESLKKLSDCFKMYFDSIKGIDVDCFNREEDIARRLQILISSGDTDISKDRGKVTKDAFALAFAKRQKSINEIERLDKWAHKNYILGSFVIQLIPVLKLYFYRLVEEIRNDRLWMLITFFVELTKTTAKYSEYFGDQIKFIEATKGKKISREKMLKCFHEITNEWDYQPSDSFLKATIIYKDNPIDFIKHVRNRGYSQKDIDYYFKEIALLLEMDKKLDVFEEPDNSSTNQAVDAEKGTKNRTENARQKIDEMIIDARDKKKSVKEILRPYVAGIRARIIINSMSHKEFNGKYETHVSQSSFSEYCPKGENIQGKFELKDTEAIENELREIAGMSS